VEELIVRARSGPYSVIFTESATPRLAQDAGGGERWYAIDARVARLHARTLAALPEERVLRLRAHESTKTLRGVERCVARLLERGVRRGDRLVAVGGGIVQDVVCFVASVLFRGLSWELFPTTLLAQADSCVGSKSSINLGGAKNLLGTFCAPARVVIASDFIRTLAPADLRSGIGEMLKAHAIAGPQAFAAISRDYPQLLASRDMLARYVRRSLEIKRPYVESDELDQGVRNLFNYGHSFGHALEAASDFAIPHGIAVTLGMDMANAVAVALGRIDAAARESMRGVLERNAANVRPALSRERFFEALARDKKNTRRELQLILLDASLRPERVRLPLDAPLRSVCEQHLAQAGFPQ